MGTRGLLPAFGRRLFGPFPGPGSFSSSLGWAVALIALFAMLAGVVGRWAARHDAIWGGVGGELLGYLPLVMLFGPPIAALCLLWLWLRR
jgi:hypothetical protein